MDKQIALKSILGISIAGMLFSGYLSYGELILKQCTAIKLGLGSCAVVSGIPACVYGFVMYLVVFLIAILGIRSEN